MLFSSYESNSIYYGLFLMMTVYKFINDYYMCLIMADNVSYQLSNLDQTIQKVRNKISEDPDPFLVEMLKQLKTIRENQQNILVKRAEKKKETSQYGGFRGYGVS